jgi:hypothetical protein
LIQQKLISGNLLELFNPPWSTCSPFKEGEEIGAFQEMDVQPFRDYRGVEVVGAWTWLPQYQLGIATKIDANEAYRPLEMLRWVFVVLILLLLLASILIFLFSILNIQWKQRLAEAQLEAKRLGQYHLEAKIGEGGMGTVYRAKHALLRRETAIKLLTPDKADDLSLQRFEREVKLTSQLTHPNTIQIYDYGHTPEGLFYYAMEFLDGLNLKELVSSMVRNPQQEWSTSCLRFANHFRKRIVLD